MLQTNSSNHISYASCLFRLAEARLMEGDTSAFIDLWIDGRTQLASTPYSEEAAKEIGDRWTALNDTFECMFEWSSALEVLQSPAEQENWRRADGPNFNGAKMDRGALERLNLLGSEELIFVGSGAFPQTLLYLADHTPIKNLVGIDRDPERMHFSNQLLKYCDLQDRVQLCLGEASDYDFSSSQVIIMASLLQGKGEILNQIKETAQPGTTVFLRVPSDWGKAFYETPDYKGLLGTEYKLVDSWKASSRSFFETQALELSPQVD